MLPTKFQVNWPFGSGEAVKKLEMCQYDTGAPAQGHSHPCADILQKMKIKKGP